MKSKRVHPRSKGSPLSMWVLIIFGILAFLGSVVALVIHFGHKMPKTTVDVTSDGKVKKFIIKQGTGKQAAPGNKVKVHYTGTLSNGKKFDSSRDRNSPFGFTIGQGVIEGWSLGVATMKVGEIARFSIHSDYGYGDQGYPPVIPPKSTLIFEIELLEVK